MRNNRLQMRNSLIEKYIYTKEVPRVNLPADDNKESNEVQYNNEFIKKDLHFSKQIIKKRRNKNFKVFNYDLRPSYQIKMNILTALSKDEIYSL